MNKLSILFLTLAILIFSSYEIKAKEAAAQNFDKISNKYFSINLPASLKGTYSIKKKNNGIFVYEKEAKKAGFGGFAFGVKAYKNPSEHAMMPGAIKIGELVDKKAVIYDMVLIRPTDVQFDYTKGESKSYMNLYNLAKTVNVTSTNNAKYIKDQGMKGKDLYKNVLKKHVAAIKKNWDSNKLEQAHMSYMYNVLAQSNQNVMDKIGYTYYDINGDGIDELLIGEITQGDLKGIIYDIYTMVNRKPAHVVSGGSRDRYFACDDGFLCNDYSQSANESGKIVYNLVENSTELFLQVAFKYDDSTNKNNPWFISYDASGEKWDNVSEKIFDERIKTFERYNRFDYTPLSKFK